MHGGTSHGLHQPAVNATCRFIPKNSDAMRHAGQFALHWQSHGLHYGIGIEIDGWLAQGHAVVVNGSRGYLKSALLRLPPPCIPCL